MEVRGGPGVSWGPRWPKGAQMSEKDVKRDFVTPPPGPQSGPKMVTFFETGLPEVFLVFLGALWKKERNMCQK